MTQNDQHRPKSDQSDRNRTKRLKYTQSDRKRPKTTVNHPNRK